MPTYNAHLGAQPTITPTAHTFLIQIYSPTPPIGPRTRTYIGTLTFTKDPAETWAQAQTRCHQQISDYIATYEQERLLQNLAGQWLQTQQWQTP